MFSLHIPRYPNHVQVIVITWVIQMCWPATPKSGSFMLRLGSSEFMSYSIIILDSQSKCNMLKDGRDSVSPVPSLSCSGTIWPVSLECQIFLESLDLRLTWAIHIAYYDRIYILYIYVYIYIYIYIIYIYIYIYIILYIHIYIYLIYIYHSILYIYMLYIVCVRLHPMRDPMMPLRSTSKYLMVGIWPSSLSHTSDWSQGRLAAQKGELG